MHKIKLSPYHRILYNEWKLNPSSNKYNIVFDQTVSKTMDVLRLQKALQRFVKNHLLLNSHVREIDGELYWVKNNKIMQLEVFAKNEKPIYDYISKPFNIERECLYRFAVFLDNDNNYRVVLVWHHLIIDGASGKIFSEISNYYNSNRYKTEFDIVTQTETIESIHKFFDHQIKAHIVNYQEFWNKQLLNIEPLDLSFLKPHKINCSVANYQYHSIKELRFHFSKTEVFLLNEIRRKYVITTYMYSQCIFAILLYRYTCQIKFAISYPVAIKGGIDFICGAKVNTNLLVYQFDKSTTIIDLFNQNKDFIKSLKKDGVNYSLYPINEIIKYDNRALLDVTFAQTNLKDTKFNFINAKVLKLNDEFNIDLSVKLLFEQEMKDSILNYRVRYDELDIDTVILNNFIKHYRRLFIEIMVDLKRNIVRPISNYSILDNSEYRNVIYNWNLTKTSFSKKSISQLFEEQVKKTPDNYAVVYQNIKLTYKELNKKSNQLAHYLRNYYQVKPDDIVALCLDRNENIIISILAVIKSGGAYIPLDPDYSDKHIRYILIDTKTRIIISNSNYKSRIYDYIINKETTINAFFIDDTNIIQQISLQKMTNPSKVTTSKNLAYIIYTSGTTGKPKGIMIEHKGLVSLIIAQEKEFNLRKQTSLNYLWYSNYVFDAHVSEIFTAIIHGHTLHILDDKSRKNLNLLAQYIEHYKIQVATIPPILLTNSKILKLKTLIVAGDKICANIVDHYLSANIQVINAYGPTENTVCTTMHCYKLGDINTNIGRPIANTMVYVLDKELKPVPIGAVGELYISGIALARGYLNLPELTEKSFIINPFKKKNSCKNVDLRLYKTGDLVRWLPNAELEYIGRNDTQVKINGCRVELSEIENVLNKYKGIEQSAVIARNHPNLNIGSKYLVGYYVSNKKIAEIKLLSYLSKNLPPYMVPNKLMCLKELPITTNGKLNKDGLPELSSYKSSTYIAPSNDQEELVCEAFAKVLCLTIVSVTDDFFQLGGNSVMAIALMSILQTNFDINVDDIFSLRTPRNIASKTRAGTNMMKHKLDQIKQMLKQQGACRADNHTDKNNKAEKYFLDNKKTEIDLTQNKLINNVLLTGATGYLGSNILNQLLLNNYKVYLIVRAKNEEEAFNRVNKKFQFYHGKALGSLYKKSVFIVAGDIEKSDLGMSATDYLNLSKKIDSIIHCAALVNHYGEYEKFYLANVKATINLLELTKLTRLKDFHYISTLSVFQGDNQNNTNNLFTEDILPTNLSQPQNFYVRTKWEGEQHVINYRKYGISANIYRLGNLAFMLKNNCLQENIENNAFFYWLRCIIKINCIAIDLNKVEISPADVTAEAIVKIFDKRQLKESVYHIFNPNVINISHYLPRVDLVSIDKFIDRLYWYLDHKIYDKLIVRFLLHQGWLVHDSIINSVPITILQDKTGHVLRQLGFKWMPIDRKVLDKYISDVSSPTLDHRDNFMEKQTIFENLEKTANFMPTPIYWLDRRGALLGANEQFFKGLGIAPADCVGKTAFEVHPYEIALDIHRHNQKVMDSGLPDSQEEVIKDLVTGTTRYFKSVKTPLFDNGNQVIGFVGTSIDITDGKEAERLRIENEAHKVAAEEQEKFRKLADQVAHDIRSPLASLLMIVKSCNSIPEAERIALREAAVTIGDIANNLLDQYKSKDNDCHTEVVEEQQSILVSSTLLQVLTDKKYQYQNTLTKFDHDFSQNGNFAFITIEPTSFKRMISNIINNSVEALEKKEGKITIKLDSDKENVKIIIKDNGKGMSAEIRKKILNNISVTSGKEDGHGIGLTQVRETLQRNSGELSIDSKIGVGTKVVLKFPRVADPDWIAEEIKICKDDIIVILDDDSFIHGAWDLRFIGIKDNSNLNLTIKHFEVGKNAINYINSLPSEEKEKVFLLTDYELLKQELNGLHVVERAHIKRSILVTSHYNDRLVRELAKKTGTKILPKQLASEIPITIGEREIFPKKVSEIKNVDMVIVDDDKNFMQCFLLFAFGKVIDTYYNPIEFLDNISQYPKDTKICLDNNFDISKMRGLDIAKQLYEQGYTKLYIISGQSFEEGQVPSYVTVILKTDVDKLKNI